MAHQAADSLLAWLAPQSVGDFSQCALDAEAASRAKACLIADARGLLYSSTISFLSAIESAKSASFSWAIAKLYYTCFYAARSILASNNTCIFYGGTKPYSIVLAPGSKPRKESGVTHKIVWTLFSREFPNNILLNEIDGTTSYIWMTRLRETANYKNARFPDPLVPEPFAVLDKHGVDATLTAYHADPGHLLTFDKDHAAIAFPMACINQAARALERSGGENRYDQDEIDYISTFSGRINVDSHLFI